MILEPNEPPEFLIVIRFAIEPAINDSPGPRRGIHQRQIASAHQLIETPIGFGEKIAQFYLSPFRCNTSKAVAHSARGTVVTLPETRGQDQDFPFHESLGGRDNDVAQKRTEVTGHLEFNGYLGGTK